MTLKTSSTERSCPSMSATTLCISWTVMVPESSSSMRVNISLVRNLGSQCVSRYLVSLVAKSKNSSKATSPSELASKVATMKSMLASSHLNLTRSARSSSTVIDPLLSSSKRSKIRRQWTCCRWMNASSSSICNSFKACVDARRDDISDARRDFTPLWLPEEDATAAFPTLAAVNASREEERGEDDDDSTALPLLGLCSSSLFSAPLFLWPPSSSSLLGSSSMTLRKVAGCRKHWTTFKASKAATDFWRRRTCST
mmetsp:Transcript_30478/g.98242  ORF Transcript_30478/g.98242 Transcript_30478/m.98242 type:complete len:255 (-) Transcript_30478:1326-2090(-)